MSDHDALSIRCDLHGNRSLLFTCVHIAEARHDQQSPGFVVEPEDDHPLPLAWCLSCEDALAAAGRQWSEQWKARAAFKPLCDACYAELKGQAISSNRFRNMALPTT